MSNEIVVVLGPGRSGTSLLMQILSGFGMRVSENLIEGSEQNPKGPYEDRDIFSVHRELLRAIKGSVDYPLPEGWLDIPSIGVFQQRLENIVNRYMQSSNPIWGFKDPKTVLFLPLWYRIFNKLKITPKYLLAIRDPRATIASMHFRYNKKDAVSELFWLTKTLDALMYTSANCFIVHYEDWFENGHDLGAKLIKYVGLDLFFDGKIDNILNHIVENHLNRAIFEDYVIQNPNVSRLYNALKICSGTSFDRSYLIDVAKECCESMEHFKGWYLLAQQTNKKLFETHSRLEMAKAEASKVKTLEDRISELEKQNSELAHLTTQLQKLQRQIDHFMLLGLM